MENLDPEEERLITEAMLETAGEDLRGPALEFVEDTGEKKGNDNVPKSKVQFPFKRRNSSRNRKIFCVTTFLVLVCGTLVATYFILKTKTFSFELKIQKGQVLHYKLTQESSYEGINQVHSNFAEDVFVQVVNKTGSRCWMKVSLKTFPNSKSHRSFLVSVNLGGQKSINTEEEKHFKIFTRENVNNKSADYYTWTLLTQLFPVVKIDLFEVILSQIATRKHEISLKDSKFFPGKVTMKQNIRMSKEHVLVTSKIDPKGFTSFGLSKSTNLLPDVAFTFEEDTAISKTTGMIDRSNMEVSAKIPLYGDLQESAKTLVMRFTSSLRLVKEEDSTTHWNKPESTQPLVEVPEVSTPTNAAALQYFSPSYKIYNEKANVVERVKELLNLTREYDSEGKNYKTSKELEEFAKSFHKIVKPGVETNFAETKTNGSLKSDSLPVQREKVNLHGPENRHGRIDDEDDDGDNDDDDKNYSRTNDAPPYDDDDDDDERNDDDDHMRRWNKFGQAVPTSPDEDDDNSYNDDNYNGPPRYTGKSVQPNIERENDATKASNEHIDNPKKVKKHDVKATKLQPQHRNERKEETSDRFPEGKQISKTLRTKKINTTLEKSDQVTKKSQVNKDKSNNIDGIVTTPLPQEHEQNFFDRMFDGIWDDENDNDPEKENQNGFQFSNLVPFSFSSHFPFVHFRWPHFDARKRRSLDLNEQQKVGADVISHDKRDVIHPKKSDVNTLNKPEVIHRFKRDVILQDKPKVIHRFKRDVILQGKPKIIHRFKRDVNQHIKRDVIHRDKRRLYDDDYDDDDYTSRDLESVMEIISPGFIKEHPKHTSQIFHRKILGLAVDGELEHEVKVSPGSDRKNNGDWVIHISLLVSVDKHKFKVLHKTISMKEIEERFIKNSKPKYEFGTVHAGTLVLCTRLHYIENICVEMQLGFVLHISHSIDNLSKEYPVELSLFFKHLAKVDVTLSSHMTSLLGSHGIYGQGALFGVKIPLKVRFSELKNSVQWCSVASLKSKVGVFYESWKYLSQWSCPIDKAVDTEANCNGLSMNSTHKSSNRLWYKGASTKKLHFLNDC